MAFTLWPAEVPMPRKSGATRAALDISDLQEALTRVNAAMGADKALIADVRVFDDLVGGNLGEGKKSLALTVRMQPKDQTLTEKDIEAVSAKVVEKVTKASGGSRRG